MTATTGQWTGLAAALGVLGALSWWSYASGGFIFALAQTTRPDTDSLAVLRAYLASWGALAPAVYVLFVIIEVLVAPIPGTVLYAPGGAIFGGFLGGSLSLAGNVIGAGVACLIARFWEQPIARSLDSVRLRSIQNAVAARGLWLILLLRINPLTSSDLVSYAAGLVGVPVWKVVVGTLVGMAPLCYAQAYLADRLFRVLPWSGWTIVALGTAYAAVVIWIAVRRPPQDPIDY
jgi:uncharacterized membrane protein YdjX (TVP38/TMEM64 family)